MSALELTVAAAHLQPGDRLQASGGTVLRVSRGISTPAGKVDVDITYPRSERAGYVRRATWNAGTQVHVSRETGR